MSWDRYIGQEFADFRGVRQWSVESVHVRRQKLEDLPRRGDFSCTSTWIQMSHHQASDKARKVEEKVMSATFDDNCMHNFRPTIDIVI